MSRARPAQRRASRGQLNLPRLGGGVAARLASCRHGAARRTVIGQDGLVRFDRAWDGGDWGGRTRSTQYSVLEYSVTVSKRFLQFTGSQHSVLGFSALGMLASEYCELDRYSLPTNVLPSENKYAGSSGLRPGRESRCGRGRRGSPRAPGRPRSSSGRGRSCSATPSRRGR